MRLLLEYFYYWAIRFALSLRYKIKVEGLEKFKKEGIKKPGGILFLANHPSEIDPCILLTVFWWPFRPHPVAIDYLFQSSFIRYFLNFVGALAVPHFEHGTNSYKKRRMDVTYESMFSLLRNKENLLIYPSGGLKKESEDTIGGASGAHTILQACPEANLALVRIRGLWGSSFSRAITGSTPNLNKVAFARVKDLLKNFLFFSPRRHITIVVDVPPPDFPYQGSRLEVNKALERWYNQEGPDPLTLVPYFFWKKELPKAYEAASAQEKIDLSQVPEEISTQLREELAALSNRRKEDIRNDAYLARDLGLDSLDLAQLLLFIRDTFGVNNLHVTDLVKVEDALALAARLKTSKGQNDIVEKEPQSRWKKEEGRPKIGKPEGQTIPEAFLRRSERMDDYLAAADPFFGEVSYRKMKFLVLLFAERIKKLPHDNIGIMMPSSLMVNVVILATMLAKKTPVMINWTLGKKNLESVVAESGLKIAISSWGFLDRLENTDLNGLDDKIVLLDEIAKDLTLKDKLKALVDTQKSVDTLLRYYSLKTVSSDDNAVILFTSGTENVPKGVPLSHKNILSNQIDAFEMVSVSEKDVLFGVLPPFHSFGFSVTGLFPLLTGMKAVYFPNPTDGKKMALMIEKWKISLLCIVPTFLKNLLRVASEKQLATLRLVVTGAEKTPPEIFEKMTKLNPKTYLGEGYGITECGPILTLNPLDKPRKGVGVPLKNVEITVVDPEKYSTLPENKEGLILARGPNVFKGYLNARLTSPFLEVEGKSWYNTGDLGHIDENHYVVLSGRLKRFVKIGGEMISLGAIEETLLEAASKKSWKLDPELPSLGITAKEENGKKGEIHLFAIFPVTVDQANEALKESGMSNLIRITKVHILPFIPLLGTGKIDYKSLEASLNK